MGVGARDHKVLVALDRLREVSGGANGIGLASPQCVQSLLRVGLVDILEAVEPGGVRAPVTVGTALHRELLRRHEFGQLIRPGPDHVGGAREGILALGSRLLRDDEVVLVAHDCHEVGLWDLHLELDRLRVDHRDGIDGAELACAR